MTSQQSLLSALIDDEVIAILKSKLTPEQVAELVMEQINPYWKLTTEQKAKLAHVSTRQIRRRGSQ